MKIVRFFNINIVVHLTVGDCYNVLDEDDTSYKLLNDKGLECWYDKVHFM